MNGFTEILTWILCSYKENFSMLNRKDDKSTAVIIGNPRSADFEVCLFNNCSQWWCAYLYSLKKYVSATISWNINLLFGFLMLIEMVFFFFFMDARVFCIQLFLLLLILLLLLLCEYFWRKSWFLTRNWWCFIYYCPTPNVLQVWIILTNVYNLLFISFYAYVDRISSYLS